jgi:endonuclease III
MKRLGQLFCRPEAPACMLCPLIAYCPSSGGGASARRDD